MFGFGWDTTHSKQAHNDSSKVLTGHTKTRFARFSLDRASAGIFSGIFPCVRVGLVIVFKIMIAFGVVVKGEGGGVTESNRRGPMV